MEVLVRFSKDSKIGRGHKKNINFGFIDDKLVFMKVSVKSVGIYTPHSVKYPIF
jgi:hypothetical protein